MKLTPFSDLCHFKHLQTQLSRVRRKLSFSEAENKTFRSNLLPNLMYIGNTLLCQTS